MKKFVFSSTCATYGPPDRVPMTEDLPQRPINPYGESKLMFEKMLHWYQQIHGLEFIAFRYFNAAGASDQFGEHHRVETHLIPNVLQVALGQEAAVRDLRHRLSHARRHLHPRLHSHCRPGPGAHPRARAGQAGLLQPGQRRRLLGARVIQMCERCGQENPGRRKAAPSGRSAQAGRRGGKRAVRELGWKPEYPKLEDIVTTAWNWHKQHPNGYPD